MIDETAGAQESSASGELRVALLIPTYNNPKTIRKVVEWGRKYLDQVIVVDDGSSAEGRAACAALQNDGLAVVVRRPENGGKGAAIKDGFRVARQMGFTHVMQADADGQHDLSMIPRFVALCRERPDALVLGCPKYDETAPNLRRSARKITNFWVNLEVGRGVIDDAMIGFRIYPLGPLETVRVSGNRMSFDIEICVRAAWAGIPIVNEPVPVRYLSEAEGGVSHFNMWRDNFQFSWLHARLTTWRMVTRVLGLRPARPKGPALVLPSGSAGGAPRDLAAESRVRLSS